MAKKLIGGKLVETKNVEETSLELQAGEACKIDQFIALLQKNIQDRLGFEFNKAQLNNLRYVFMDTIDETLMTCSSLILNKDYRLTRKYVQDRVTTPPKQADGKNTLFKGHFEVSLRRSFHTEDYIVMGNYDAKKNTFKALDGTVHKLEKLDEDEIPSMVDEDIIELVTAMRRDFNSAVEESTESKPAKKSAKEAPKKDNKKPAAKKVEEEDEEQVSEELMEAMEELTKDQLIEAAEICEVKLAKKDTATIIINKLIAEVDEASLLEVIETLKTDSEDDGEESDNEELREALSELTKEQLIEIASDNGLKVGKKVTEDAIIATLIEELEEDVITAAIEELNAEDESDDENEADSEEEDDLSKEVQGKLKELNKEQLVEIAEMCDVEIAKKDKATDIIKKLMDEVEEASLLEAIGVLEPEDSDDSSDEEEEEVKEEPKKREVKKAAPVVKEEEAAPSNRRKIIKRK